MDEVRQAVEKDYKVLQVNMFVCPPTEHAMKWHHLCTEMAYRGRRAYTGHKPGDI
jgi:hypothetical protein